MLSVVTTPQDLDERFRAELAGLTAATVIRDLDGPVRDATTLTAGQARALYDAQCASRHLDLAARWLRSFDAGYYTIGSSGHEGNAAVAAALRPTDPALLHYRSGGFYCARAAQLPGTDPVRDVLRGIVASTKEPIAGGRHKVFGHPDLHIIPTTSTIASHLPRAVGIAYALGRGRRLNPPAGNGYGWPADALVVCSFGDASVNHAAATAAFNTAGWCDHSGLRLPLLFVCEDNAIGISVRSPSGWVEATLHARPGLRYFAADGCDIAATYDATSEAAAWVRRHRRPAVLHLSMVRLMGHAGADAEVGYRSTGEIEADVRRDPLVRTARLLVDAGLASPAELMARYDELGWEVRRVAEEVLSEPKLGSASEVTAPLAPRRPVRVSRAVNDAAARLVEAMAENGPTDDEFAVEEQPESIVEDPHEDAPASEDTEADDQPVDNRPDDEQPDDERPGDAGPGDARPGDEQPGDDAKPNDDEQPGDDAKPNDDEQPGEESSSEQPDENADWPEPVAAAPEPEKPVNIRPTRKAAFNGRLPEYAGPLTLAQTINAALTDALLSYPQMVVFGEDVALKGGVYGVTKGLRDRFGAARVFDTLLDETSILGLALGSGVAGLLPVPEIQYLAYLHNAEDQLRGEAATMQFFSQGAYHNPMVVRVAGLAYQAGFGGHFHNDNAVAVLRDIPGLVVAAPARAEDAAAMLRTCLASAVVDGSVCVFLEPIALYHTRDLHTEGDGWWLGEYAPPTEWQALHVPIGRARVYASGPNDDLTIITFGNGVRLSLRAAARLAADGIGSRVVDLRWLSPLPVADIIRESAATGRVLVVDETRRSGGVGEGVLAALVDAGYVGVARRVAAVDSFIPLGPAAGHVLVSEEQIVQGARSLLAR
jgi:2-oxoisovalerate dehydrogenase E1 component